MTWIPVIKEVLKNKACASKCGEVGITGQSIKRSFKKGPILMVSFMTQPSGVRRSGMNRVPDRLLTSSPEARV